MKKNLVRYWPVLAGLGLTTLLVASPAFAQNDTGTFLNLRLPIIFTTNADGLFGVFMSLIRFVLLLGGIITFFYFIYGGFIYLTSGGDSGKASAGQKIIVNAIIGIVIILISYALLSFVVNRIAVGGGADSGGNSKIIYQ